MTAPPEVARHADERRLWELAGDGDVVAREHLVERHVRLAHKLARRYARTSEPIEDLEQVACVGLLRADAVDGAATLGVGVSQMQVSRILRDALRRLQGAAA